MLSLTENIPRARHQFAAYSRLAFAPSFIFVEIIAQQGRTTWDKKPTKRKQIKGASFSLFPRDLPRCDRNVKDETAPPWRPPGSYGAAKRKT
jgi:hypothetical protein